MACGPLRPVSAPRNVSVPDVASRMNTASALSAPPVA